MQMDPATTLGLIGALIAGYAYLPQIGHLIKERCSAGISRSAFGLWVLSSILVTTSAVMQGAAVFIILGVIQIAATGIIVIFSTKYQGQVCEFHQSNVD